MTESEIYNVQAESNLMERNTDAIEIYGVSVAVIVNEAFLNDWSTYNIKLLYPKEIICKGIAWGDKICRKIYIGKRRRFRMHLRYSGITISEVMRLRYLSVTAKLER